MGSSSRSTSDERLWLDFGYGRESATQARDLRRQFGAVSMTLTFGVLLASRAERRRGGDMLRFGTRERRGVRVRKPENGLELGR